MIVIFNYMLALVAYCWIDEIIIYNIKNNSNQMIEGLDIITNIHYFAFGLFLVMLLFTIPRFNKYRLINIIYIGLAYIKYAGLFIFTDSIDNYKFELRRILMWLFITPAMLDIYTKSNKISLKSIKPEYHIIPNLIYFLTYYYKNSQHYNLFYIASYISQGYFLLQIFKLQNLKYTRIYLLIWMLFGTINLFQIMNIVTTLQSNIFFGIADIIAKFTSVIIIYDFEEQKTNIRQNVDLQSVDLMSSIFNLISEYKKNNILTDSCSIYIDYLSEQIKSVYPNQETQNIIKLELLKKILPYELDDKYLLTNIKKYEQRDNLCVMFIDIVSYSELALNEDSVSVYTTLNKIYTNFDLMTRKYKNIQKIETIGDSYMVVGDLTNKLDIKSVVNNMIMLALNLIKLNQSMKYDDKQIDIRIGINCGPVVIGILGLDIPRLCVIGNTVNKAARLESTSKTNKIQISHEIYDFVKDNTNLEFELNENVHLKNIGTINTYFVNNKS
jgi:class 3 adenylate cyclase